MFHFTYARRAASRLPVVQLQVTHEVPLVLYNSCTNCASSTKGYGAVWAYEKGPGLVLSIANTILLVYTIVNIVKAQCCDTAILSNAGNSRHGGTTCFKGNSRALRATRDDATRRKRKRFLWYSLYVWGCPTVIIVTMAVMEFTPGMPNEYIRLGIDKHSPNCYAKGYGGQWAYKYGPLMLLSLANTALMVYTIVQIAKAQCCDTAILNDGGNSRHDGSTCLKGNTRWIVYINLLCLMGPPRVVFIACWAVYMNGVALDWNFVSTLHYCTWLLQATERFLFICCRPRLPRLLLLRVKTLGLLLVAPLTKRSDKKHGPTADSWSAPNFLTRAVVFPQEFRNLTT